MDLKRILFGCYIAWGLREMLGWSVNDGNYKKELSGIIVVSSLQLQGI